MLFSTWVMREILPVLRSIGQVMGLWQESSLQASSSFGNAVGSTTLTLDEYLVIGLDLISSDTFAKVLRNRSGVVTELNSLSGWNILPGDELMVEVAIQNRGISSSIPTTMTITHPDGQISTHCYFLHLPHMKLIK